MNRWLGLAVLLVTFGALALRSPDLARRPMHNDEAVNAEKIKGLWQTGRYKYDPNEHHGPTLYYATLPFVVLSGARSYADLSETTLRAVSVFFGVVLILLVGCLADGLGRTATLTAAVLTAISPAMVFYSRYFIHEMLLVCFSLMLLLAGWRYVRRPGFGWALLGGAALGLMYATKETFVLAVAAFVAAVVGMQLWSKADHLTKQPVAARPFWGLVPPVETKHALVALLAAGVVALVFFTSIFTNASGPIDSVRTYVPWLKRAGGESPHIHPWYFYLERLVFFKEGHGPIWSEGLILLLALVGCVTGARRIQTAGASVKLVRFLMIYAICLTGAYSLIAYKTPWCLLGFLQPIILLAGVGVAVLLRTTSHRALKAGLVLALLAAGAQLGWQTWRASYLLASDRRNPYVYAQTLPDVLKLIDKVQDIARLSPDGDNMLIKVVAPESDYWPLPWYLRQFKRVGWWDRLPSDPYAPVMIVGASLRADLDDKSDKRWLMVQFFELRPKTFLELYVQDSLWEEGRQPPPEKHGLGF